MQFPTQPAERRFRLAIAFCALIIAALFPSAAHADHLTLEISGKTIELEGDILIEAQDESLYFRDNTGKIWFVQPTQIKKKVEEEKDADPISAKELGKNLLEELPEGFRILQTKHYVIAYQNEAAYAKWIGGLYEGKLYRGFEAFWRKKNKLKLTKPKYPLVAIIFGSRAEYQRYVDRELGPGQEMVAYYNVQNNRVAMFDLTAGNVPAGQKVNDRKIEQVLQNPAAINMVATIIHEGTHQLMFNRGVQTRFADSPLWINEGAAMFFEAPDLRSKRGWQRPGLVFETRFVRFVDYVKNRRPADSLQTLIMNDDRFRETEAILDSYAEAWAINHFLLNRRSKDYVKYLEYLSTKKALIEVTPQTRLAEFKEYFGDDLEQLDRDFLEYISRLGQ